MQQVYFNRTMLAEDYIPAKLKFPLIVQPKVDGVRGLHPDDRGLLARSLKYHGNVHTRNYFSQAMFFGFDGELAAEYECHPDLCRLTTSATSSHEGEPWLMWHVFDDLHPEVISLPYLERLRSVHKRVAEIKQSFPEQGAHLKAIPYSVVNNLEELEAADAEFLDMGYEGTIIRDPAGPYKNGRSTPTKGELLRIKRFKIEDAVCVGLIEAMENNNAAFLDERGYQKRSSHQENLTPKGMVGALVCLHPGDLDLNNTFKVGPGKMTHAERIDLWNNQFKIVNQTIKYKHFPHGMKDKPRLPTFELIRSPEDVL